MKNLLKVFFLASGVIILSLYSYQYGNAVIDEPVLIPLPAYYITEVIPNKAPAGSADLPITVSGEGFKNNPFIIFNNKALKTESWTPTAVKAKVPASYLTTVGIYSVFVEIPFSGYAFALDGKNLQFTVFDSAPIPAPEPIPPAESNSRCDDATKTCKMYVGAGKSNCVMGVECSSDKPVHNICNASAQCVKVEGEGETTCFDDSYCSEKKGSITVIKQTVFAYGKFDFASDIPGHSNFSLETTKDNNSNTGGNTITFDKLAPGAYSIYEVVPAGWNPTASSCDNGDKPEKITLKDGKSIVCIFTNNYYNPTEGSITVIKITNGGNAMFLFNSNFGVKPITTQGGMGFYTVNKLKPGNGYSISEIVPQGWNLASSSCNKGTIANIEVTAGSETTCTFYNTKKASEKATLMVEKTTSGGGDDTFNYNMSPGAYLFSITTENGFGSTQNEQYDDTVDPGTYTIEEVVPSGWKFNSARCYKDGDSIGTQGDKKITVTVSAGDKVTCRFSNTVRQNLKTPVLPGDRRPGDGGRTGGELAPYQGSEKIY